MTISLSGKTILVTGGARRLGRLFSITAAQAGANIIIHHSNSYSDASKTAAEVEQLGRRAWIIQADFRDPQQARSLVPLASEKGPIFAVVNNSAIYENIGVQETTLDSWQVHLNVNLTAPFLIAQAFADLTFAGEKRRIINILDSCLHPASLDHFPYVISKIALTHVTKSLALAYAPNILVNGLALGPILTPTGSDPSESTIQDIPLLRRGTLEEVAKAFLFLLTGPEYITGQLLYLDGGRHLVSVYE